MSTVKFSLSIPKSTYREIKEAARAAAMRPAEVARQSLRLGVPLFAATFPKQGKPMESIAGR